MYITYITNSTALIPIFIWIPFVATPVCGIVDYMLIRYFS